MSCTTGIYFFAWDEPNSNFDLELSAWRGPWLMHLDSKITVASVNDAYIH